MGVVNLVVSTNGDSIRVHRIMTQDFPAMPLELLVNGRSMSDVLRCIEEAVKEAQAATGAEQAAAVQEAWKNPNRGRED